MSTTTLRGMTWEHERGHGSVVKAAEAYRLVAPDVDVQWDYRSLQAFADQDLESLVESYDLLVIDHPHIPIAAEENLFLPLDGRGFDMDLATLAKQSVGRSHESYQHLGRQWGLALDAAAQVAAYRPDLLETPPSNWAEVIALAEQGRVLWPHKPVDAFSSLITIAAGLGEDPMVAPGVFLSAEKLAEAMELLMRLARLVPTDNAGFNPIQTADLLASSDTFAYAPLLFGYANYSRKGYRPHRVQYIDIPRSARGASGSLLGGAGIAVSSKSRVANEAVAHAFWLASGDVQEGSYYEGGGQPGNSVAWESPRINDDSLDFFTGTRATLEGSYMRPRFASYIELQNAVSPLVTSALVGTITITELRDRLDSGVAEWLVR